jgi:PAS domain S-box-containing protein
MAAGAIAIAYFLTAELGLALLSKPTGVAVFWPASGVAAGILITFGRRARPALVIGVVVGTIAANLIGDRSLWTSIFKGFCNAGEAVFVAWLLERWFDQPFTFADLRRVLGFVAAACLGAAASALGGAVTMTLFHTTAPFQEVWRAWFLADGIGIVAVAPLIIGLAQVFRKLPSRAESIEGLGVLALLTLSGLYLVGHPTGSWLTFDPDVVALPLLLWLTARCQPAFGIAGAFVASITVLWATAFGVGHFGDASVPLLERVNDARVVITMVTLYTLVLAALFAERRRNEAALNLALHAEEESKTRLADAMVAGHVMAFEWDAVTGLSQRDNAACVLGFEQGGKADSPRKEFLRRVHADDRDHLKTRIHELRPGNPTYAMTFRIVRPDGGQVWLEETGQGEFDASGALLRIKGLTRDITERKLAELALAERNAQLSLAARAALVGSYVYDVNKGTTQVAEGYAVIHGLPEGTTETTISEWRARVHPDDLARAEGIREQAFAERRKEDNAEYRIVLANGEVRWIERRGVISYSEDGRPERVVGVNIDVTERKRAEQHQRTLNAELDHRVKNVLATVSAIIAQTQEASGSRTDFVTGLNSRINSLARTHELLSESNWRGASLAEIVRREFAPYTRGNTEARGPSVTLRAEATQAVATVLHELTTNAAKYGALSNQSGRVSVQWRWLQNGSNDRFLLEWQETGGPPVLAPSRSGYGTSIIRELIPFELGGAVELSFAAEGTNCRLEIPGEWISRDRQANAEEIKPGTWHGYRAD